MEVSSNVGFSNTESAAKGMFESPAIETTISTEPCRDPCKASPGDVTMQDVSQDVESPDFSSNKDNKDHDLTYALSLVDSIGETSGNFYHIGNCNQCKRAISFNDEQRLDTASGSFVDQPLCEVHAHREEHQHDTSQSTNSPCPSIMSTRSIDDLFDIDDKDKIEVGEYPRIDSHHLAKTLDDNLSLIQSQPTALGSENRTTTESEEDDIIHFSQIGLTWKNKGFDTIVNWERNPMVNSIIEVLKQRIDNGKDYSVKHMWTGTYNKFYSVDFEDRKYVMKLTLPICSRRKTESEVATIQWTGTNTNLRSLVPEVIDYSSSANNPIGCEWILMKRLEGVPLSSCWREVELGSKERIVKALAEYAREVYKRQFRQIGNLFPAPLPCRGRRFQVGKISSMRFFWNRGLDVEPDNGPFRTNREWTQRRLNMAHEQLRHRSKDMKQWSRYNQQLMWRMLSMSGVGSTLWRLHDVLFPPDENEDSDGHEIIALGPSQLLTPAASPSYSRNDREDSESGYSGQDIDDDMNISSDETTSLAQGIMSLTPGTDTCNEEDDYRNDMRDSQQESWIARTADRIPNFHGSPSTVHRASGFPLDLQFPSKDEGYCSGSQQEMDSSQNNYCDEGMDLIKSRLRGLSQPSKDIQGSSISFDQSSHRMSRFSTFHDGQNQHAPYPKEWEPIRPKAHDYINMDSDLDQNAEPTMLWHDNLSADNILVDPETGRLTGVLDWDCVSCLPTAIACDWPAFLYDGKHRATKPDMAQYSVWISDERDQHQGSFPLVNYKSSSNDKMKYTQSIEITRADGRQEQKSRIALQANYWRALRDFELTYLRKVFTQEMSDKCPLWYNTWKQTRIHKDYEAAVQNCDNEHVIGKVEAWCEAVEMALDKGQEIKPPQVMSLHCTLYESSDWKYRDDLDDLSTELMKPLYEQKRKVDEWQDDLDEFHAAKKSIPNAKGLRTKKAKEKAATEKFLIEARQAVDKHTEDLAHLEGLDEQGLDAEELARLRQEATTKTDKGREEIKLAEAKLAICEARAEAAEKGLEAATKRELDAMERIHSSEWFKKFDHERTFNYQTWKNLERALYKEYGEKTWWKHRLEPLGYCGRKKDPNAAPNHHDFPEGESLGEDYTAQSEVHSEISEEE